MQIKRIEELTKEELRRRMAALWPLCEWGRYTPLLTKKMLFMQSLWENLKAELSGRGTT